jgi:succinylglutamic semialdehyde dehydrogenase
MNTPQREYLGNYLLGAFVRVNDSNGTVLSRNPGDLDIPAVACPFSFDHVHEAVIAANRGFTPWRKMALSDRLAALSHYRKALDARAASIAEMITFETGKPLWESRQELAETLEIVDYYLESASKAPLETRQNDPEITFGTRINHYPRGVVAVVSPGINPVSDVHLHVLPALVFGNAVVMKASRSAPLVGQAIAECFHQAQLPAGVFNLVHGDEEVARRLVSHPEVQVVLYTGSYDTGLKVQKQIVSDYWKTSVLDMVGKNSILIWEDAHYAQALHETIYSAFLTSGQRRTTASRVLVHESLMDRFLNDFHSLAKKASVGYGFVATENSPFMGPLLNEGAVENYIRYQGIAVREGCEEIMRGKSLERNPKGHYVSPSLHRVPKPDPKSVYQKSEIFGPNVALYGVTEIEEAIEILNLSQHGLVASVYSASRDPFMKLSENVKVGTLHWNRHTHTETYRLPRGGLKKSGNSRAMGSLAWQQCTYPVVSTETEVAKDWDSEALPLAMPRGSHT